MGELFERVAAKKALAWTGERLTGDAGRQVEIEHLHRYLYARALCRGLDVLDVAAGEGYGSALLAQTARSVVGVELDQAAVMHAQDCYVADNLSFLKGDARCLPIPDASLDVVVSFETIEHFYEHDLFINEVRRVIRPGGKFIVSSPERDVYSPVGHPPNPYHVRELTRAEFERLLQRNFGYVTLLGQRPMLGSALIVEAGAPSSALATAPAAGLDRTLTFERRSERVFEASDGLPRPVYLVAVASDVPPDDAVSSLYIDSHLVEPASGLPELLKAELDRVSDGARHVQEELALCQRRADDLQVALGQTTAALDEAGQYSRHLETEFASSRVLGTELSARIGTLEAELTARSDTLDRRAEEARAQATALRADLASTTSQIQSLRAGIAARDQAIAETNRTVDRSRAERSAATAHIERLAAELNDVRALFSARLDHIRTLEGIIEHHRAETLSHRAEVLRLHEEHVRMMHSLQAVLASSSWRMTWPIRSLVGRSTQARQLARRAAKLLWWTATLQLPRRIAAHNSVPLNTALLPVPPAPAPSSEFGLAPIVLADPGPGTTLDLKSLFTASAKQELVEFLESGDRIVFPSHAEPEVSVVVVLWNQAHLTLRCLRALQAQVDVAIELVIVDNASSDDTATLLSRIDGIRVLVQAQNAGFLIGCNLGTAAARGRTLLLLNSDAFVRHGTIEAALRTLDNDATIGAVGGRLILPSGVLQEAGSIVWSDGSTLGYGRGLQPEVGEAMFRRDVDYCSGAFLLTPRVAWRTLGGFDEAYCPAYYEEADYCMRLREIGLRVVYEPTAVIDHFEFGSEAKTGEAAATMIRNRNRFSRRHAARLAVYHHAPSVDAVLAAREQGRAGVKRLLVIDNEVPLESMGAGYPRAVQLLREAAALGWALTFFPLHQTEIDWDIVRAEVPRDIELIDRHAIPRLAEFLAGRRGYYDALIVSRPNNMELVKGVLLQHPDLLGRMQLVYDAEALFSARDALKAGLDGAPMLEAEVQARFKEEIALAEGAVAIICVSDMEAEIYRAHQATPVHILSHPVEPAAKTPGYAARSGFLFVGRLLEQGAPNWQGLSWFVSEAWPLIRASLPDATLTVVGRLHAEHTELDAPGIRLVGPVKNLQPLYDQARIFLSPIRFAAGVPIKIIEATAAGLPSAGTRLMARQLGWTDAEIVGRDTAAELATAVVDLYQDETVWSAMRKAAQHRLQADHGRPVFQAALKSVLDGLCGEPPAITEDTAHRIARVEAVWGGTPPVEAAMQWSTYPLSHPTVQAAMNRRATGDAGKDAYDRLIALLAERGFSLPLSRTASLCCGAGALERNLIRKRLVSSCVGFDLAAGAVEAANAAAAAEALPGLSYRVRDLEREGLGLEKLDLVLAHQGIHHLANIEAVFDSVYESLAPGGVFHLHEFVGPDRFQWPDRQIAEITRWLQSLPEAYRITRGGMVKSEGGRATIEEMIAYDPSEAVRSSAIEPAVVAARFEIIEHRALGGNLAMMALADIGQNFDPTSAEAVAHIERLLDREDELLRSGELHSDFAVIIARRPQCRSE